VHPQAEQESIFMTFVAGRVRFGGIYLVVLDRHRFEGDDQKRSSTFLTKNMHHRQNPGYAYDMKDAKTFVCERVMLPTVTASISHVKGVLRAGITIGGAIGAYQRKAGPFLIRLSRIFSFGVHFASPKKFDDLF